MLASLSACQTPTQPSKQPRASHETLRPEKLSEMDAAIKEAIGQKQCPGGVLWIEHRHEHYQKAYGNRAVIPLVEQMTEDTIFDAASLTKVIACTPAILLLVERGKVKLDAPAQSYIQEFSGDGRERITVRHLLTHRSGLPPDIETTSDWHGRQTAIKKAIEQKLEASPGTDFEYSDINFILLGEIAQRVSGVPLEQFVAREIYKPLRMNDTGYLPPKSKLDRIAPTEVVAGKPFRGLVHDPTARRMGGVAGHAGLFTTAADLAQYARMILNDGSLDGVRIFKPETVKLMTSVQTPDSVSARRGLGWDIDSGYSGSRGKVFPLGSYGHTGWTGTSLWIDPFSQSFVIFLSNRNHPDENGNVIRLRARLGTLAGEAISDFNFAYVPGALAAHIDPGNRASGLKPGTGRTLNGVDVLVKEAFAPLKGLRIGLITNHTGQDRERNATIDLLRNAPGVELKALFSPEHGIRGLIDEQVPDSVDEKTGLPVYSLYQGIPKKTAEESEADHRALAFRLRKPKPEQLQGLDALVFDIQDIGCRFYTYTSTLGLTLEAAGENAKKFFVLDRVNPINGTTVDGSVLTGEVSFVGFHPIPLRYGMTIGELAQMFNAERNSKASLTIIRLQNWRRDFWLDETGLPWTSPSPNIRSLEAAILYPGVGLLESALSVGRGTDTPFEVVGAPYIDDRKLAAEMNEAGLAGVRFLPVRFTPRASVHKDEMCGGVRIMLTDRDRCRVVDVGLLLAQTLYRLYPKDFDLDKLERLLRHPPTLEAIKSGRPLKEARAGWEHDLKAFLSRREKFLLYQ